MSRKLELKIEDWPQPCHGGCGRLLRPPKYKAADFPNHKTACSQRVLDPWCQQCLARQKGKEPGHRKEPLTEAEEEARIERIRQDLLVMIADRRRRGVPPEGVVMPGDEKIHLDLQRRMPGEQPAPKPRTPRLEETATPEAPLGHCRRGHPFDGKDPVGRRTCSTCAEWRLENNRRRRVERDADQVAKRGKGHCRRGHPFTHVSGDRKYCPTCKAMSRKRVAMRKAKAQHAS